MKIDKYSLSNKCQLSTNLSSDDSSELESSKNEELIDSIENFLSAFKIPEDQKDSIRSYIERFVEYLSRNLSESRFDFYSDDAYGNDAEYWHGCYEELVRAKYFIEKDLATKARTASTQLEDMRRSRDKWERKCNNLKDRVNNRPVDIKAWPKYADDLTYIHLGDMVKSYAHTVDDGGKAVFVSGIVSQIKITRSGEAFVCIRDVWHPGDYIYHADPEDLDDVFEEISRLLNTSNSESLEIDESTILDDIKERIYRALEFTKDIHEIKKIDKTTNINNTLGDE